MPGDIEAVHYDFGGEGVSYKDASDGDYTRVCVHRSADTVVELEHVHSLSIGMSDVS